MAISKALMKIGKKALTEGSKKATTKGVTKATKKATKKAVEKALTKSATKRLPGAGISTLAKGSGSTLDGILGRSSGLVLPEPKITPVTLAESAKLVFPDENISTIGDMITKYKGSNLDKIYKNKGLSKKSYDTLKAGAREAASINNPIEELNALGITSKSGLPTLNRDQYHYDTLGSLRNADGSKSKYVSGADVPDYMKSHLSNNTPKENDSILRELFDDDTSDLNELYDRYERLAQGANANKIYTPENIDMGVELMGKEGKMAEQDFADRLFGGKKDIKITKSSSGAKNIKVSSPKTTSGVEDAVAQTTMTTNPVLADEIAEPRAQVSPAGGGMRGGGTPTATASPDYGGLGDSGFNVHLKDGKDIDISLKQPMSKAEIRRNRAIRNLDDDWAKGLNATKKQYGEVVAKSKSAYKGYKTPAEMARLNGISLDNINETPQAVVDAFERRKLNIEKYAEDRGVNVRLDNLDLTNIEPATKATMKMQGIDPDKIRYTGVASPLEAETLYKDLRNRAVRTTDGDRAVAYNTMADYVRNQIDDTMDNLNIDFSAEMSEALGEALGNNADRQYLRSIATNKKLKFSDLRREQADWIKIGNLSGNPLKEGPTINVFGVDTGAPNPFTAGADKIKEKIYERQAYGAGGAGGSAGGGSGAENNINFTSPAGGGSGTLGNLLGKAKTAGLVGAGVLGGLALGGGGGGGSDVGEFASLGGSMMPEEEVEIDPYQTLTIGGYTYDQLEAGYTAALMAGDTDAANLIANMIGMLDDKAKRYSDANSSSSSSSGIASKQRAALNVLSGLMQNYQAQGPIGGGLTQLLNAITGGAYNPAVSAYDSGSRGALGTIIKALGDTGALSEGDQTRALELLPKTTDSEEAAKYKYQQLIQILQGAGAQ